MRLGRRLFLKSAAGACVGLPLLHGLRSFAPRSASAQASVTDPFAIFVVHGNGVQQGNGAEPDRFWPTEHGALGPATMSGRAVEELAGHSGRLLIVSGVDHAVQDQGDHDYGGAGILTAQPAVSDGPNKLVAGESLDWRIGRELNPPGREPLNLYAGFNNEGWIGATLSFRGPGERRAPQRDPFAAYQDLVGLVGGDPAARELLIARRRSVNDLVRPQLERLLGQPRLSRSDRQRIDLHLSQVRDLEQLLIGRLTAEEEAELEASSDYFNEGERTLDTAALHMKIAALAVVSGVSRAVAIQVGPGQDNTPYVVDGQLRDSFHYISHRVRSDSDTDAGGSPEMELLHHAIDRMFLATFRGLVDRLDEYGALDDGVALWTNNLGDGPNHSRRNLPVVLAGSAGGVLRQGQYVAADGATNRNLLSTIGSAVGLRVNGGPLVDFGHPDYGESGLIQAMIASEPW